MATIIEKYRLLKGLLLGGTAYVGPFYATIDITRRCNLNCPGCILHSLLLETKGSAANHETFDISFDLFERCCIQLKSMGTNSIILIGEGEPLLHPQIFDMISVAKAAGLHVSLFTNGTLLNDKQCRSLIESKLDILIVSLWGSTRAVYGKNYPGTALCTFDRIIEGLQQISLLKSELTDEKLSVRLHHPLNRYNFQHIEGMVDIAHSTGCNTLTFSPFKTRKGKLGSLSLSRLEEDEVRERLSNVAKHLSFYNIKHNIDQTQLRYQIGEKVWEELPCYIGWLHMRIKVNGNVYPCNPCGQLMGNVNTSSLQEIWNNIEVINFRRRASTKKGLTGMSDDCDCGYCCHLGDNLRVHRVFRWLSPLKS